MVGRALACWFVMGLALGLPALAGDGDIDWAFGGGQGGVQLPLPPGTTGFARGVAVRVLPNGRIVVLAEAGLTTTAAPGAAGPELGQASNAMVVYRLLPNGTLDTGFGSGGMAIAALGEIVYARDLELGPGGTLYLGGSISVFGPSVAGPVPGSMAVVRLLADGSFDSSWADDGVALVAMPGAVETRLTDLAVTASGGVVVSGYAELSNVRLDMVFARLTVGGALDPSFGAGGLSSAQLGPAGAVTNFSFPSQVRVMPDERVVVAGLQDTRLQVGPDVVLFSSWMMDRLGTNGSFDPTFNGIGYRTGAFEEVGAGFSDQHLSRVVLLPGGSYLGAGGYLDGSTGRVALVRVSSVGAIETTWATQGVGVVGYTVGSLTDSLTAAELDGAGRVVLAGNTTLSEVLVGYARLLPETPSLDGRFRAGLGADYFFLPPVGSGGHSLGEGLTIDPHGRILIVGERRLGMTSRASLRRLEGGLPFADGFESGELGAWSAVVGGS